MFWKALITDSATTNDNFRENVIRCAYQDGLRNEQRVKISSRYF